MDSIRSDLKQAIRLLLNKPGVSAVAILALCLGMGLTTTMFSIVYGVMYRGLPFEDSEQIVHVGHNNLPAGQPFLGIGIHDYQDYVAQQRSFQQLAGFRGMQLSVSGTERAERFNGAAISSNTFELLRVSPLLGRGFTAAEQVRAADPVVIIGHSLWRDRYNSDPQILGKSIRVNGEARTIVGVMPEGFRFPDTQQLWLPLGMDATALARGTGQDLEVFGRLRPEVSEADALADLNTIALRLEQEYPATNKDLRPAINPFTDYYIGADARGLLLTMLGAVFLVMLIACTNVANLLLSRAIVRRKEVGIRTALGASRARIISQLLIEALVLCVAGAILATMLAIAGTEVFNASLEPSYIPFWIDVKVDAVALAFVFALTMITTLVAGVMPSIKASRADLTTVLNDDSRGASSFRLGRTSGALVVFEIALSCGLLVAAGLTIKSVVQLRNVDLGFDRTNLITGTLSLADHGYADSTLVRFYERLDEQLATKPGLQSYTLAAGLPGLGGGELRFGIEGMRYDREQDYPRALSVPSSTTYLETLGVAVVEGRNFNQQDRAGALPVAIVNRGFADRFFAGENVIGRRLHLQADQWNDRPARWVTIVGVIPNLRLGELAGNNESEAVLLPLAQEPNRWINLIARPRSGSNGAADVQAALAAVDPDLPLWQAATLSEAIARDTWFFRVFGGLFMVFGATALVLAAIGLYAVIAFSVSQRTREIGIRMAIGAQSRDVMRMILRQGIGQVTVGMLLGLTFAAAMSRLLAVILFDVESRDLAVFGSVVALLTITAIAACLLPARRATAIDPLKALRHD